MLLPMSSGLFTSIPSVGHGTPFSDGVMEPPPPLLLVVVVPLVLLMLLLLMLLLCAIGDGAGSICCWGPGGGFWVGGISARVTDAVLALEPLDVLLEDWDTVSCVVRLVDCVIVLLMLPVESEGGASSFAAVAAS